jgi:hydrogenase maturation protease
VCCVHDEALPVILAETSSHAFGVAHAIEMARVLGCLPAQLIVYAIEGRSFDWGSPLSPEAEAAARAVAERIIASVER